MIFQIGIDQLIREIELLLWSVANALTCMISIFLLRESFNKKLDNSQRKAVLSFGYYFLLMTLANIFNYVWRLYILQYWGEDPALIMDLISQSFLSTAGWVLIVFYLDMKQEWFSWLSIHLITIGITFLSIVWALLMDGILMGFIFYAAIAFSMVFFPIQFWRISRHSEGFFHRNSLRICFGGIIYVVGMILQKKHFELAFPMVAIPDGFAFITPILVSFSMISLFLGIYELYCLDLERNKRREDLK
ncbi:MAG: hypothetical protein GY870_21790 [archaeon]|nr:hypothetical protein [archaeon]